MSERPYMVLSEALNSLDPLEGHALVKDQNLPSHVALASEGTDMIKQAYLDAPSWLPFASEVYKVSADLKNYVMVPVKIMYSDFPNRNGVGFPYMELTRFNPDAGKLSYQTWKGKPTFVEHNNRDITIASGVILDSSMRRAGGLSGSVFSVMLLLAFDRERDPILANSILQKERTAYSMGAWCKDYSCSICEARASKGGCEHVAVGKPTMKVWPGNRLGYLQAVDFVGFECSSVATPAYHYAFNPNHMSV